MIKAVQKTAIWLAAYPAVLVLAFAILLMWPAVLNEGPFYFWDVTGYLKGGKAALSFAGDKFWAIFHGPASAGPGGSPSVMGVRSVAYSLFAYLTRAPGDTMLLTTSLQALAVSASLLALFSVYNLKQQPITLLAFCIFAAFATTAPWFSVFAMPDVFAGIAILAISLLTAFSGGLSRRVKIMFACLIAFAVCAHLSHVPIIGCLVVVACFILVRRFRLTARRQVIISCAWIALPALIGLGASVAINAIGFHQVSISGKRFPIVLASSIQAGPARWYLESHCAAERYAVCDLFEKFPSTSQEFLWGEKGIRGRATPEAMDRIRAEEPEILKRAFAAYPLTSIAKAAEASAAQFFAIGLYDHHFEYRIYKNRKGEVDLATSLDLRQGLKKAVKLWFLLGLAAALGILVWLCARRWRQMSGEDRTLLFMIFSGCVINAIICGATSAVTDRYQGRVIWVLVVAVAIVTWKHKSILNAPARRI